MGKDPINSRVHFAHYLYAANAPVRRSDPLGMQDQDPEAERRNEVAKFRRQEATKKVREDYQQRNPGELQNPLEESEKVNEYLWKQMQEMREMADRLRILCGAMGFASFNRTLEEMMESTGFTIKVARAAVKDKKARVTKLQDDLKAETDRGRAARIRDDLKQAKEDLEEAKEREYEVLNDPDPLIQIHRAFEGLKQAIDQIESMKDGEEKDKAKEEAFKGMTDATDQLLTDLEKEIEANREARAQEAKWREEVERWKNTPPDERGPYPERYR